MLEETQPKRRPGRPRKTPIDDPADITEANTTTDRNTATHHTETPSPASSDGRIGESVDDPRWTSISYPSGESYRVEDGVIVERLP